MVTIHHVEGPVKRKVKIIRTPWLTPRKLAMTLAIIGIAGGLFSVVSFAIHLLVKGSN